MNPHNDLDYLFPPEHHGYNRVTGAPDIILAELNAALDAGQRVEVLLIVPQNNQGMGGGNSTTITVYYDKPIDTI